MALTKALARGAAAPLRFGLSASELGLEIALGVVRGTRRALNGSDSRSPARWSVPPPPPTPPPAARARRARSAPARRPTPRRPEAVDPLPPVPPAAAQGPAIPAVPPSAGAKQVDDDPVPIAEFGEAGASESAGPEVHVDEPWDGYRGMTAARIRQRLVGADRATVAAVLLFENAGSQRSSVVKAADRRLRQLSDRRLRQLST